MRKIQIAALSAFVAVAGMLTSCGGGVPTNVTLANDMDTLSYVYGVNFYQQMVANQLSQAGIVKDTMTLKFEYQGKIAAAKDDAEKAALNKKYKNAVDSLQSANERNTSAFFKGFQEGLKATTVQDAHAAGQSMGSQVAKQMFPSFVKSIYGADVKEDSVFTQQLFLSGMLNAMRGDKLPVEDPMTLMNQKVEAAQAQSQAEEAKKFEANKLEGENFLTANKSKDGVVTLPSGLQYKVMLEGKGEKPAASDRVRCHYHGTLIDGTVFDSSVQRGEPTVFGVSQVIKGWTEALQLMPVGSKWQLFIPSDLAYGDRNMGDIKPNSTLIFEVELLEIVK